MIILPINIVLFGKKGLILTRFLFAIVCKYTNLVPNIKIFCDNIMSNILYPLKFSPVYKTKIWGGNKFEKLFKRKGIPRHSGESWEVSGVEGDLSVVSNGFLKGNNLDELIEVYMGDLVGDSVYETFGNSFPLLVKFIDASDDLSVQVHPGDELAWERHNCPGKTEMWYVIHAEEDSKLVVGLNRKLSKEEYVSAVENGGLHDMLNILKVENGDVFFVPPGCVHAIGKGVLLLEVQQASDITYRIFDYNRLDDEGNPRELHTDLAVDAMDFECVNNTKQKYQAKNNESVNIIDCKHFTTNIFELDMPVERDFPEIDSFIIYICVEGECRIEYGDGNDSINLICGETVLVPAAIKNLRYYPKDKAKLMEVYIKIDKN